jgi:hypothetical protein
MYTTDITLMCEVKRWKTEGTKIASDILEAVWTMEEKEVAKTGELF